jgi:two-component system LytT family response regulator
MDSELIALVVDDDEDQNIIFATALEQAGYVVKSARNGYEAREILAEIVPSMVILDLHMPGITGDVILKEIRTDPRLKHIRVIVATSDATFVSSLQFSAELVLLKPIGFSQLSQLASRFAQKPNFPREP